MSDSIEGKRVIITGGAGGIGSGVVKGLANRGAKIAAIYNRTPPAGELADLATWYQCDLGNKEGVAETFRKIADDMGGLDAMINVAGLWQGGPAEEADEAQIDFLIGANLKSAIFTNQAAFEIMKDKGGRIVNFGSVEGVEGNPGSPIYAASKAAVHGWTRSAARAWGKHGVTVNCVAPAMHTPPFEAIRNSLTEDQKQKMDEGIAEKFPLGRLGNPEQDCAPVLAFLISDGSGFMTGQMFAVDGGYRMLGA